MLPINNSRQIGRDVEIIEYDVKWFPFRSWFEDILGTEDLEHLHQSRGVNIENVDRCSEELRVFCESKSHQLRALASELLATRMTMRFGPLVQCQTTPTIRFHFAVQSAELRRESEDVAALDSATFLKNYYFDGSRTPMFHRDYDYGLPFGPINLWVPVTCVGGANSLWIGSSELKGEDARPISMSYGESLIFDGARRWHGVVLNTSGITRISFDIRFLPGYQPWGGRL